MQEFQLTVEQLIARTAILGERISASGAVRQTVPKSQQKHGIHVEATLSVLFSDWAVALRG